MKVLVLGASGMLGSAMIRILSMRTDWDVFGTLRSDSAKKFFSDGVAARLITDCDVENYDALVAVFARVQPDVVINCIGLIKHLVAAEDPLSAIFVNALLPHRLQKLCDTIGARFIHFSTDCVFNGAMGNYSEDAPSDAADLYGKSKFLGEVVSGNAITLRTSIIGHELQGAHSLLEWFLSQHDRCLGYRRAIFSGLPTVTLAELVRDFVIPNLKLSGLYHVAAQPISKYDLLRIVADVYEKRIDIVPDDKLMIDRSLNAARFAGASGYQAPSWPVMIENMHNHGRALNKIQINK
jgi:dTDP-4-dehydrorhamnose reductase